MSDIGMRRCAGWQTLLAAVALMLSASVWAENRPAIPSVKKETRSQVILRKVMEDIRRCNKTVLYEYDPKTKQINPPELMKIKGIKFKKLLKNEIAVFQISEMYEGMHAVVIWMGQAGGAYDGASLHSVAFRGEFQPIRQKFESLWGVEFIGRLRPGPDVITDGQYAEVEMLIDGKRRFLSIEKMPMNVYPYIGLTDVGCTHFDN